MQRVAFERASCEEMTTVIDAVSKDETGKLRKALRSLLMERLEGMSKNPLTNSCPEFMAKKKDYYSILMRAVSKNKSRDDNHGQQ